MPIGEVSPFLAGGSLSIDAKFDWFGGDVMFWNDTVSLYGLPSLLLAICPFLGSLDMKSLKLRSIGLWSELPGDWSLGNPKLFVIRKSEVM